MRRGRPPHPELLTPREQEVLAHPRNGLTNSEIAVRLGISPDGVKYHVSEILSKLGVSSRQEAAAWWERTRQVRSKVVASAVITAIIVAATAAVILTFQRAGSGTVREVHSDSMVARSIAELTQASDVVIIATLKREIGTRKVAQIDPNHPELKSGRFSIVKDFEVSVETYQKGSGSNTLVFSLVIGMETEQRGRTMFDDRRDVSFDKGTRYLLFLKEVTGASGEVGLIPFAEPWRFQLSRGAATVQSSVPFPPDYFPRTEEEIVAQVEVAK